jgi:hypothetical protein
MDYTFFSTLILLGIIGLCYLLPILIIASSRKTTGTEKILWLIAVLFISWFAWILYFLLAPVIKK